MVCTGILLVLQRRLRFFGAEGLRRLAVGQAGSLMTELIIAIAIFVLVSAAVMSGLSTMHRSGGKTEEQSLGENIARNQMEYVFSLPYQAPPSTYPAVATPPGYGVSAAAQTYVVGDTNIQKVVVTVHRGGVDVLVLETMRTR